MKTPLQVANWLDAGACILFAGAAAGLVIAIVNYLLPHNGIDHTWGALLVAVSTALLLLGSLVAILARSLPSFARVLLNASLLLDLLGTAVAAYFLESTWLMVAIALGLVGWIVHVAFSLNAAERRRRVTDRRMAR